MSRSGAQLPGLLPEEHPDALSVAALLARVQRAVADVFPRGRGIWVRGEIQAISEHRSGHCYMDLADPDTPRGAERPVLKVNCWRTRWGPIRRMLASEGVTLQPGMVVTLRGRVELYVARAQVTFVADEIDVSALLGRLAAQRAALLRTLEEEGVLRANAALAVPEVPLAVALVASPGTEGFDDFVGRLRASGLAFRVRLVPVQVQGPRAPASIANGLAGAARSGCDLTVLVRGGGAKADLVAFDAEVVARAVACHPVPVWTGIGHTGDQSVADVVANRAFITPTDCAQELVRRVTAYCDSVGGAARRLAGWAPQVVDGVEGAHAHLRRRLVGAARGQLRHHGERVAGLGARLAVHARRHVEDARRSLEERGSRLGPLCTGALEAHQERLGSLRRLLGAYDLQRQLERGYTLTLDDAGRIVRSVASLEGGQHLLTRFADGTARSVVASVSGGAGSGRRRSR